MDLNWYDLRCIKLKQSKFEASLFKIKEGESLETKESTDGS